MRGANDGLYGYAALLPLDPSHRRVHSGGSRDVALPLFATLNRGGGCVALYTVWSRGQRLPTPSAVLRVLLRQLAPLRARYA
jgi:hypothetical protein